MNHEPPELLRAPCSEAWPLQDPNPEDAEYGNRHVCNRAEGHNGEHVCACGDRLLVDGRKTCHALWPVNPDVNLLAMNHLDPEHLEDAVHRCREPWSHDGAHLCRCGATIEVPDENDGEVMVFCSRVAHGVQHVAGAQQRDCCLCGQRLWVAPSSLRLEHATFACLEHAPTMGAQVFHTAPGSSDELSREGMNQQDQDVAAALAVMFATGTGDEDGDDGDD